MDTPLRPDLTKILPVPLLHQFAAGSRSLAAALNVPAAAANRDFLVEVTRHRGDDGDDPGFGITQANAVAARVAQHFRTDSSAGAVHRVAPDRAQPLLAPRGT